MKKNRMITISSMIVLSIILVGCGNKATETNTNISNSEVKLIKINSEDAKNIIDKEDNEIVLDVRTIEEYKEGHIKDSVLIPVDSIKNEVESKINNKEQKILIYCRSGNRSKQAGKILIEMGYKNVYDFGGIKDWKYEIER